MNAPYVIARTANGAPKRIAPLLPVPLPALAGWNDRIRSWIEGGAR